MGEDVSEIVIKLPREIINFIENLVEKGLFESLEDFISHATRLLAEFYGLPGESVLKKIFSNLNLGLKPSTLGLGEKEQLILDAFGKSKFVYEDELYMLVRKEAMVRGIAPMSKEDFDKSLENLIKNGILERIKHGNETLIRKKEE